MNSPILIRFYVPDESLFKGKTLSQQDDVIEDAERKRRNKDHMIMWSNTHQGRLSTANELLARLKFLLVKL